MEIVLIWIVCGMISAVVAGNKGRSGCAWFIVGIVLGPLGLIWALVTPSDHADLEEQAIASGEYSKCPYCAELVRSEAVKCRYCGSELSES